MQLRGVITRSLHDVDVNVRRSTAAVLHEIAELVYDPRSVPWLVLVSVLAMSRWRWIHSTSSSTLTTGVSLLNFPTLCRCANVL